MKKLLALFLVFCVLVSGVVGCSSKSTTTDSSKSTTTQTDTKDTQPTETKEEDYSETGSLNVLWFASGGTDGKFECVYLDYQSQIPDLLYDTLLKLDLEDHTKYVPRIAEKWDISPDGLVYTFYIRENCNWTDGKPVTADDFVFSFEAQVRGYGIQNERGSFAYIKGAQEFREGKADHIEGIKADGKTLTIELHTPYSYFLRTLATFVPYPRHCFPENVDYTKFGEYEYWEFPIHCGPYKLESVHYPDSCVLVRNDDWYGPKPGIKYVHGISFSIGGKDAAEAAMIAGKLDLVHSNEFNDINFAQNVVSKNPDYSYQVFPSAYIRLLCTNLTGSQDGKWNKFMANADFRKAINFALDKEGIASYYPGQAVALSTLVNPDDPFYNNSIPRFKRDVEKAKELLKSVGYDGSTIRVAYYYNDQISKDIVDYICQNLNGVGIKTESILFTQDLANAIYEMKNWDLLYAGANQMSGLECYNLLQTGAIYDKYLGNNELRDELFTKYMRDLLVTTDPAKMREIGNILQQNGYDYCAQIPLYAMNKVMVFNDAKWDFDEAWLKGTDLAIYRTCDLRLESWRLRKP